MDEECRRWCAWELKLATEGVVGRAGTGEVQEEQVLRATRRREVLNISMNECSTQQQRKKKREALSPKAGCLR